MKWVEPERYIQKIDVHWDLILDIRPVEGALKRFTAFIFNGKIFSNGILTTDRELLGAEVYYVVLLSRWSDEEVADTIDAVTEV